MPNYSNLVQVRENEAAKLKISKEASQILEVLNELENFTITLRRKVMEEIGGVRPAIHLDLKSFDQNQKSGS